jgi:ribosomal protein S18 acetylase RimI-like enzyme
MTSAASDPRSLPESPPLRLRPATSRDVEALCALVNSAYRGASSRAGWTTEESLLDGQRTDPASLRELLAEADSVVLVHEAVEPGEREPDLRLDACVHLERRGEACYLGMLTVRPTLQAGGLGRRLLTAAEEFARRTWSSRRVEMTVIAQRAELIAWYERRGYGRTGRREPFPYGDERFGLPRRDDLVFEVLEKELEKELEKAI